MVHVKICCIQSVEEARLALESGAYAIGLVSAMPTDAGVLPEARIREIAGALPSARRFLLTSKREPAAIAAQVRALGTDTVQMVDRMALEDLREVRRQLPGTTLVQVVHVDGEGSIPEAEAVAPHVDAILLDSGTPGRGDGALGGTGRVHDWDISAEIVEKVACPVFLAGGLDAANVADAIRHVRPFGVDVCSRLRPGGALDPTLISRFFAQVATVSSARA